MKKYHIGKSFKKTNVKTIINNNDMQLILEEKKICTNCKNKDKNKSLLIRGGQVEKIYCIKTGSMITIIEGVFFDCNNFIAYGGKEK